MTAALENEPMLIGIIETGKVNEALVARHGDYPAMFAGLLGRLDPGLTFRTWSAVEGEVPVEPGAADAWLVTGSRHGVYDDLPWIAPLEAFLRRARAAGRPIIGICFGHQVLAEALGGRAVKSEKGWGIGAHEYDVIRRPGWMEGAPDRVRVHALHQDQVVAIPGDAMVLATSPFCEYAALAYGDPEVPDAISVQPHPEFDAAFMRALIELRSGEAIPAEQGRAALAGLGGPVESVEMARWFLDYLQRVSETRDAA